jgi:hypothetical protein
MAHVKNKAKLNLTVPEEQRNKLEQMASLENRSLSNLIEVMADERWKGLAEQQGVAYALDNPLGVLQDRITASSSTNAVSNSSAHTTKCFPLARCASAIQIVRPRESTVETQPQL